jgi:CRP-like cAMP-binding protein
MQSIETMLRTVPGFAQLDSEPRHYIADAAELAEAEAGDELFREGTLPESLYVLLDGRVMLTGTAADASSTVIDILEPANSFVLANVLTDEPYLMGAHTVAASQLVRIEAASMRTLVASRPSAAMAMMRAMSAELGNMTRRVVDLKVRIAAQRLGTLLGQVRNRPRRGRLPATGSQGAAGPLARLPRRDLSRAFLALRAYGVETHGSRVLLHDVALACGPMPARSRPMQADNGAVARPPVEKVFGDAFRLRVKRPHRG